MRATSLKGRHIEALLQRWRAENLSSGTMKNRLAHLRWWAEKVGRASSISADNDQLGIPERRFVTNENKARELGNHLNGVTDARVHMSLRLQQAFGLRREESIKFQPNYADRGDHIVLRAHGRKVDASDPCRSPRRSSVACSIRHTNWLAEGH
jgi:hypothetical protein